MVPNEQGRYCSACSKTVIDFTNYSDQEIADYFIARNGHSVCGRLFRQQIDRIRIEVPETIFISRQPSWKKFLVICLLVFGTSVFPFETTLSQSPTTIATSLSAKDNQKKKLKRKSKKKKNKETPPQVNVEWVIAGNMNWQESSHPPLLNDCSWSKPHDSSKNLNEDSLVTTNDLPKKDKKSDQPSENDTQFIVPSQPYKTRRSPKKKP